MKRIDLMSKAEIVKVMKPSSCCDTCIVPKLHCREITDGKLLTCSSTKELYLNEEVKVEKKRRCDIYSKEELVRRHDAYCNRIVDCNECEYSKVKNNGILCEYNFTYAEVDTIDGKEVDNVGN